jgi:hypothetical protein
MSMMREIADDGIDLAAAILDVPLSFRPRHCRIES